MANKAAKKAMKAAKKAAKEGNAVSTVVVHHDGTQDKAAGKAAKKSDKKNAKAKASSSTATTVATASPTAQPAAAGASSSTTVTAIAVPTSGPTTVPAKATVASSQVPGNVMKAVAVQATAVAAVSNADATATPVQSTKAQRVQKGRRGPGGVQGPARAPKRAASAVSTSRTSSTSRKWNKEDIVDRKKGKWGNLESKTLMAAVYAQAQAAGIDPSDLCGNLASTKKQAGTGGASAADIKQIWHKIAANVPRRTMRSCYYHAESKLKAAAGKSGKWSDEEKQQLMALVEAQGQKWTLIGNTLGRYSVACKDAYRRLALKKTTKQGPWTPEENDKLTNLVLENHADEEVTSGRAVYPSKNIMWRKIAAQMGGRNEYQCCNSWNQRLHGKVTQTTRWSLNDDIKLLRHILRMGVRDESEIPWATLPFKSTPVVLKRRFKHACRAGGNIAQADGSSRALSEVLESCIVVLGAQVDAKQTDPMDQTRVKKIRRLESGPVPIKTIQVTPRLEAPTHNSMATAVAAKPVVPTVTATLASTGVAIANPATSVPEGVASTGHPVVKATVVAVKKNP